MKKDKNRSGPDRQRRATGPGAADVVEAQVLAALRLLGWAIPQSEEEVAEAERQWGGKAVQVPDAIRGPADIGSQSPGRLREPAPLIQFPRSPDVEAMLGRAAREGAAISPQIEERMRRDRKAAEDKLGKAGDGEHEGRDGR